MVAENSYFVILFEEHKNKSQSLPSIKSRTGSNVLSKWIVQAVTLSEKNNFNVRTRKNEHLNGVNLYNIFLPQDLFSLGGEK